MKSLVKSHQKSPETNLWHLSGPLAPLIPKVCVASHGHLAEIYGIFGGTNGKTMGKIWENAG
jgi:hypothetical protein